MSDDSAADSTIDLKKTARRRLVGATALALLAVIVLPIIMDSEPKPTGHDIQIHIPDKESGDLLIGRSAARSPDLPSIDSLAEAAQEKPLIPGMSEGTTTPLPIPGSVSPALVEKQKAADSPINKPSVANKTDDVPEAAVAGSTGRGQWVVQLGAYRNAANVKQLTGKLQAMGIASYTESFDSAQGARTRVRAGPFKSQEAAEKAQQRIKKLGVDGSVSERQ